MARKNWFYVGVLLMCMMGLFAVVPGSHATLVGDYIKLSDNTYSNWGGGPFGVDIAISQGNYDGITDYYTFCLEQSEYFSPGKEYYVYDVSHGAIEGGQSGGNPDPLSYATAYLFYNYTYNTLLGFDKNSADDNKALQNAIWSLEGEGVSGWNAKAQSYKDLAETESATWTDYHGVYVVNMGTMNPDGTIKTHNQSNLAIPEPGTMLMVGSTLFLLAGFGTRRFRKKK